MYMLMHQSHNKTKKTNQLRKKELEQNKEGWT